MGGYFPGIDVGAFLGRDVYDYIMEHGLYGTKKRSSCDDNT